MKLQKNNKLIVRTGILAALVLGMMPAGRAQQTDPAKPTAIDSFSVVRDYKPLLADAVKIRRSPDMANKRSYMPKLSYADVPDKKLDINTGLQVLEARETPHTTLDGQTSNYAKFGMGNFSTFWGEGYFSYDAYQDMRLGGFVKHINQKGPLDGQQFDKQAVGIFGRRALSAVTLDGTMGYDRHAVNFYGAPDTEGAREALNPTPEKQSFDNLYFTGELISNPSTEDQGGFSYSAKVDAYHFSDRRGGKEMSFAFSTHLNERVRDFNIGVHLSADMNSVRGTDRPGGATNNSLAILNPYIRFKGDNYAFTLGANFIPEFGDSTSFNIFPAVDIDLAIAPEYFHIFGGVNGSVQKASYRSFARENPFLGDSLGIRNTVERLHVYGGIKGNSSAVFGYKVRGFYRQLEGLPLFVNHAASPQNFHIVYDGDGDTSVRHIGLEGEISMRLSQAVNIGGRLNIDNYTMAQAEEAWHRPDMRLTANARFNISEKLYIDAEALFHSASHARTYAYSATWTPTTPGKTKIPSFFDLSAGAEFKVTSRLGLFAKANNILNTEYQTYLYYPKLGFGLIGGLNLSF